MVDKLIACPECVHSLKEINLSDWILKLLALSCFEVCQLKGDRSKQALGWDFELEDSLFGCRIYQYLDVFMHSMKV